MDESTLSALRTAASAVFDVGFATMIGALATLALLQDTASDWAARGARRGRTLFARASLLVLVAAVAWMAVQAISMGDLAPSELGPVTVLQSVADVVAHTTFGRAWAVVTAALAACIAMAAATRYRPVPLRAQGVAVAVAAFAHARMGHAGANGFGWLVPAMAVHLLATGLWAGTVFAVSLGVLRGDPQAVDGVRYARRLSALATAALAGVVATGFASAWHALGGSIAPLASVTASPWSVALDVKLCLVASAVVLGGFNRFVLMPALPASWPRFVRVLRIEAVVLLAVLVAAAVLANGEPPAV